MPLSLVRTVAPTDTVVTTAVLRAHVRRDDTDDDTVLAAYLSAATDYAERYTQRSLMRATYRLDLDEFPAWEICLPMPPVASVSSVIYDATDGTATTLGGSYYRLHTGSQPARLTPAYGQSWPASRPHVGAVRITYLVGETSTTAIPQSTVQAILLLAAHWYENREQVIAGTIATNIPLGVNELLNLNFAGTYQ